MLLEVALDFMQQCINAPAPLAAAAEPPAWMLGWQPAELSPDAQMYLDTLLSSLLGVVWKMGALAASAGEAAWNTRAGYELVCHFLHTVPLFSLAMLRALRGCAWPPHLKQPLFNNLCRHVAFRVCSTATGAAAQWRRYVTAEHLWAGLDSWRRLAVYLAKHSDCPSGMVAGETRAEHDMRPAQRTCRAHCETSVAASLA